MCTTLTCKNVKNKKKDVYQKLRKDVSGLR